MKELVKMSKLEFSANTLSDPITNVNAYYSWVNSKITLPSDKVTELETNRCLSKLSLTTISKYKEQYYEILKQSGFLEMNEIVVETNSTTMTTTKQEQQEQQQETPAPEQQQQQQQPPQQKKRQYFTNGEIFLEMSPFSAHSNSLPLLKALLCSGLFPNVALFRDK